MPQQNGRPAPPPGKTGHQPPHPNSTASREPAPDKPVGDPRQGNKDKFAWFYDMLADTEVSNAAKVVGSGCVMKMAGRKGHFKATRKAIATLCGISQATVRRGLADLITLRYLTVELGEGSGAANTYYLKLTAQRYEEWLTAEWEYRQEIARAENELSRWLYAEKQWLANQKEIPFRAAVFDASIARGADPDHALRITDHLVRRYRDKGLELDIESGLASVAASKDEVFAPAAAKAENPPSSDGEAAQKRADPGSPAYRPRLTDEPTPAHGRTDPGSPAYRPRLTPDAPTSANSQTHKSFKDSERPVKVFQDLESEPALRDALPRALRAGRLDDGACQLCGPDGAFLDPDGYPVVLGGGDSDEHWTEIPVKCQHTMDGNLAEIQRMEKANAGFGLCKTGWPAIDSHYPLLRDD